MISIIACPPIRFRRTKRSVAIALLPITAVTYMLRQVLLGSVLWLWKRCRDGWQNTYNAHAFNAHALGAEKTVKPIDNTTPPAEIYGPLPLWQMADIQATGHKRAPLSGGDGKMFGWVKSMVAVLVLVFAVACDDFVRFEAERFICDPHNGLGLQEAELVGKSSSGKMRLTFADGGVQEVKSTVSDKHYMVQTPDFRAKIDRKTGQVSGKRGAYSTSFACDVHSFKM